MSEERLVNAMKILAYIMSRRTEAEAILYALLWERLERELASFREKLKPVNRVRQFLEQFTVNGQVMLQAPSQG